MLNIPKEKAPNTFGFLNEYIYNKGYYFTHCNYPTMKKSNCYYLKKGCTGCKDVLDNMDRVVNNIKNKEDYNADS